MHMCLQVIELHKWNLIMPKMWPSWTMLLQALGSVRLCWEGMQVALPQVCASFSALTDIAARCCLVIRACMADAC